MDKVYDIVIIGAGITGALGATVLSKLGYQVLLLEKGRHPRFALGESATPLTTHYFEKFAHDYGIPELDALSNYDKMKSFTDLNCGPKELFYYLPHKLDVVPDKMLLRQQEVVVRTRSIDLQYDRAQLDQYLTELAVQYGAEYIDQITVNGVHFKPDRVQINACHEGVERNFQAKFIIDSSGHQSVLARQLDLRVSEQDLDTPLRSRCIFSHFKGVRDLEAVLSDGTNFNPLLPVHRRRATQHHVFDGGWYWFIPFDNGVTSVGLSLDVDLHPFNDMSGEKEFWAITDRLPVVRDLLSDAESQMPFIKTGRLQFSTERMAGARWALMPAAAFGIDAWQSTGMTLSFMALDRLVWTLDNLVFRFNKFSPDSFEAYQSQLSAEFYHLSRFIHGIYKSFKHKELFGMFCLLPFLGIERFVIDGGLSRPWDPNAVLMSFGNSHWKECFYRLYNHILAMNNKDELTEMDIAKARRMILEEMAHYNSRSYGCPSMKNIYLVRDNEIERAVSQAMSV